jgi:hypothetical protein
MSHMPSKKHKPLPELSKLESAVLERLWRAGEADVVETRRAVGERRGITINIVGPALRQTGRRIVEQNPSPPRSSNVLSLRWEGDERR